MKKWIGLKSSCLISGIILIASLFVLVEIIPISLSLLTMPVPVPLSHHMEEKDISSTSVIQESRTKEKSSENKKGKQIGFGYSKDLLIVFNLVVILFAGIFFSTFTRALVESIIGKMQK